MEVLLSMLPWICKSGFHPSIKKASVVCAEITMDFLETIISYKIVHHKIPVEQFATVVEICIIQHLMIILRNRIVCPTLLLKLNILL